VIAAATKKISASEIIGFKQDSLCHDRKTDFYGDLIALICLLVWGIWWTTGWKERRQVDASGGLYFPGRLELTSRSSFGRFSLGRR
jgi:hypothetical protein